MAARKSPFAIGVAVAVALGIGAVSLRLIAGGAPEPRRSGGGPGDAAGEGGRAPPGGAAVPASSASLGPAGEAGAAAPAANPPAPSAAARPAPDEGPDAEAWRKAKVAFQLRELGRMAPYVKTALDAARRDMAFCFRKGIRADAGAAAPGGDGAPARTRPAVLLLYLEAREGALDVVEARTEHLGDASPELVECCCEVLRGLEIPAFGAIPGQRVRLEYRLE